jgi:hypothetical protein
MTITAQIGFQAGDFTSEIHYDDVTRDVTATATGPGFSLTTVQITASQSRTVAFFPVGGGQTVNADLAARMASADFRVTSDGQPVIVASGVPPASVNRIVGKTGSTVGGLPSSSEWRGT